MDLFIFEKEFTAVICLSEFPHYSYIKKSTLPKSTHTKIDFYQKNIFLTTDRNVAYSKWYSDNIAHTKISYMKMEFYMRNFWKNPYPKLVLDKNENLFNSGVWIFPETKGHGYIELALNLPQLNMNILYLLRKRTREFFCLDPQIIFHNGNYILGFRNSEKLICWKIEIECVYKDIFSLENDFDACIIKNVEKIEIS